MLFLLSIPWTHQLLIMLSGSIPAHIRMLIYFILLVSRCVLGAFASPDCSWALLGILLLSLLQLRLIMERVLYLGVIVETDHQSLRTLLILFLNWLLFFLFRRWLLIVQTWLTFDYRILLQPIREIYGEWFRLIISFIVCALLFRRLHHWKLEIFAFGFRRPKHRFMSVAGFYPLIHWQVTPLTIAVTRWFGALSRFTKQWLHFSHLIHIVFRC